MPGPQLVTFLPHALLILEERLKAHQAQGMLSRNADVTGMALRILVLVQLKDLGLVRCSRNELGGSAPSA